MRISDWSSDVCSSDLALRLHSGVLQQSSALGTRKDFEGRDRRSIERPVNLPRQSAQAWIGRVDGPQHVAARIAILLDLPQKAATRSEERRVGKECVRTCRYRWSPNH